MNFDPRSPLGDRYNAPPSRSRTSIWSESSPPTNPDSGPFPLPSKLPKPLPSRAQHPQPPLATATRTRSPSPLSTSSSDWHLPPPVKSCPMSRHSPTMPPISHPPSTGPPFTPPRMGSHLPPMGSHPPSIGSHPLPMSHPPPMGSHLPMSHAPMTHPPPMGSHLPMSHPLMGSHPPMSHPPPMGSYPPSMGYHPPMSHPPPMGSHPNFYPPMPHLPMSRPPMSFRPMSHPPPMSRHPMSRHPMSRHPMSRPPKTRHPKSRTQISCPMGPRMSQPSPSKPVGRRSSPDSFEPRSQPSLPSSSQTSADNQETEEEKAARIKRAVRQFCNERREAKKDKTKRRPHLSIRDDPTIDPELKQALLEIRREKIAKKRAEKAERVEKDNQERETSGQFFILNEKYLTKFRAPDLPEGWSQLVHNSGVPMYFNHYLG